MMLKPWLMAALLCAGAIPAAQAAPPRNLDPDWPCMQIKVPELSVAAVWAGPPVSAYLATWSQDADVADLAGRLVARRVPMQEAQMEIADFAKAAGHDQQKLLALFAGVFQLSNQQRASVLAGLDRFGKRQKELAAQIRSESAALSGLQANASPDVEKVGTAQNRLNWDLQVFRNRSDSIHYACDAPALIEQRLFAVSRAIQAVLPQPGQ